MRLRWYGVTAHMARFIANRDETIGLAPGQLVFVGEKKTDEVQVRLMDYGPETLLEEDLEELEGGEAALHTSTVSWINVNGLHDIERIRRLGTIFGLHPLLLEDILNTGQRPKLDETDAGVFVVLKMLRYDAQAEEVISEQLSLVIGPTWLLTFQERPGDVFEPVRKRIRKVQGRLRVTGVDYLAYALLDTVVDNYIHIIETLGSRVEDLDVAVTTEPDPSILTQIQDLRREMSFMRKSMRPAREAILHLSKLDTDLIKAETGPFLKDLLDNTTQATEAIDTYREMLSDVLNIYNSSLSNRMNDIMKVLTIFAAIFIPLTFIAGIYGTNFEYVPELHYRYGYFIFWGVMVVVAIGMLVYFRRRKWL